MLNRLRTFYCGFVVCDQMACSLGGLFFWFVGSLACGLKVTWKMCKKTWCLNSLKNHINKQWNIIENPPKIVPNPTHIDQKRHPNQWKCVLGPFSAQNRDQVGSRTLPGFFRLLPGNTFGAFLAENGSPLGHIVAENRSKILFLSIDRRLELPKMTSGRVFGKSIKL